MADFGLSGLASGFDWRSFIDQLLEVERVPQQRLRSEQNLIEQRKTAYGAITTQLSVLQNRVKELQDAKLFGSRVATSSDEDVATVSAEAGTQNGTYQIAINQLATAARQAGLSGVGRRLSETADVSGVVMAEASFPVAIVGGTFTVNGKQITVAGTDTLQDVFDKIDTATGGVVTGSYEPTTDRITLSSAGSIILGSAADTSNFLTTAKLFNNGTGTVTSSASLGTVKLSASLTEANLVTPINDGGSGEGRFKINGVEISFSATDSVAAVIERINASAAGVSASYDSVNDQFILTNEPTGDVGIALEDVTGNFLAATGLSSGALARGNNLLYSINGSGQLVSYSNTITEGSSGITGLSVTARAEDTVTITVNTDTEKIKTAITDFIEDYNRVQSVIDDYTASSTDADGQVTAGVLAGDPEASSIARQLRSLANNTLSGLTGSVKRLESLGITSNGNDNNLALTNTETMDEALLNRLEEVKALFIDDTVGLANSLNDYLESTVGEGGTLEGHQDRLTEEIADIDTQISDQERMVLASRERMIASFVAMEQAQQRLNQQLQFLLQRFGTTQST
jgi:flagellar hook-associated protein 2